MDVTMITQLINGVGFPIAACIAMAVFIYKDRNAHTKLEQTLQEMLLEITKNCASLTDKLDDIKKDGG